MVNVEFGFDKNCLINHYNYQALNIANINVKV